jgi:ABC-type xylose transport system permease subunit
MIPAAAIGLVGGSAGMFQGINTSSQESWQTSFGRLAFRALWGYPLAFAMGLVIGFLLGFIGGWITYRSTQS